MPSLQREPVWKHTRRELYFVDGEVFVSTAAKIMSANNVASIIVTRNGKAVGIFTEKDIVNKIVAAGRDPKSTRVSEIMSSPLITIDKNEPVEKALALMEKNDIRRVVVLDSNGKTYGMLVEMAICGDLISKQTKTRLSGAENESWLKRYLLEENEREVER